jgi:ubiquinone/menaquinone biosynthesis C-methylase UbiE
VAWCQENIGFATVMKSEFTPPLEFLDDTFDILYAASVFTRLTQHAARQWAAEMARIVKPGGALIISFHGSWYEGELAKISADGLGKLQTDRIFVYLIGPEDATFDGSNNYATFMTKEFVQSLFDGFEILEWFSGEVPTHFAAHQDMSLFRRL